MIDWLIEFVFCFVLVRRGPTRWSSGGCRRAAPRRRRRAIRSASCGPRRRRRRATCPTRPRRPAWRRTRPAAGPTSSTSSWSNAVVLLLSTNPGARDRWSGRTRSVGWAALATGLWKTLTFEKISMTSSSHTGRRGKYRYLNEDTHFSQSNERTYRSFYPQRRTITKGSPVLRQQMLAKSGDEIVFFFCSGKPARCCVIHLSTSMEGPAATAPAIQITSSLPSEVDQRSLVARLHPFYLVLPSFSRLPGYGSSHGSISDCPRFPRSWPSFTQFDLYHHCFDRLNRWWRLQLEMGVNE